MNRKTEELIASAAAMHGRYYEEWHDPANANCNPRTHGVQSCMTQEHYGGNKSLGAYARPRRR